MVQFQHESKPQISDYWKLDSGTKRFQNTKDAILRVLTPNNQYLKSRSIARIRGLYIHHQRGLLSYERLTARELKVFVKQRGLTPTSNTKPTTAILRAQLEQADDDATFDRFSDLPPELRQQIFKQYFDSFDDSWMGMSPAGGQPPITLASRQTRVEALPLFYSRCHFRFHTPGLVADRSLDYWPSQRFVRNTPAAEFGCIRFLNLCDYYCQYNGAVYYINISIDLEDDECSTRVSDVYSLGDGNDADTEAIRDRPNQRLMLEPHTFIRGIAARAGRQKLQKTDMQDLDDRLWRAVFKALLLTD